MTRKPRYAKNRPFRDKIRHFESGANSSKARWVLLYMHFLPIFERVTHIAEVLFLFSTLPVRKVSVKEHVFLHMKRGFGFHFSGNDL